MTTKSALTQKDLTVMHEGLHNELETLMNPLVRQIMRRADETKLL